MCGRYLLYAPVEALERTFALDLGGQLPNLEPRDNIAPTQYTPMISDTHGKRSSGGLLGLGAGLSKGSPGRLTSH